jgi:YesN/AraC family two-component response regulator
MLVDDDHLVRGGLRAILSSDDSIEVVGEAENGRLAVQRARHHRPDVVLMDVRMPDLDGIAATAELLEATPTTKVIILRPSRSTSTSSAPCASAPAASSSSAARPNS